MHSTNHINSSAPTYDVLWCFRRVKLYCNFMVLQSEFLSSELLILCIQAEVKHQTYIWFARVVKTDQDFNILIQFSWSYDAAWKKSQPWMLPLMLWRHSALSSSFIVPYFTSHHTKSTGSRRVMRGRWKRRISRRKWRSRIRTINKQRGRRNRIGRSCWRRTKKQRCRRIRKGKGSRRVREVVEKSGRWKRNPWLVGNFKWRIRRMRRNSWRS
jgi:hypothetical protein